MNCASTIDPDKGTIRAFAKLLVAETVENPFEQLSLKHATKLKPGRADRRGSGRGSHAEGLRPHRRADRQADDDAAPPPGGEGNIYEEFKDRAGDIVSGTVRRFDKSDVIVDLGKFEGVMTVPRARAHRGLQHRRPHALLRGGGGKDTSADRRSSCRRSHPNFVRRLFEFEVSEIADRTVEIVASPAKPATAPRWPCTARMRRSIPSAPASACAARA